MTISEHLSFLDSFVAVLDEGSLSAGARRMGISQPAVSQQIRALESRLGKQLLYRSAQGSSPTRAGQVLYRYAQEIQVSQQKLLQALDELDSGIEGQLRVSSSLFVGEMFLGQLVQRLRREHPNLEVILRLEDRFVDVVRENFDLAFRVGGPGETEGYVRKLAEMETSLIAKPSYLARVGAPQSLEDLASLEFIEYREDKIKGALPLSLDGQRTSAKINVGFTVDTPQLLRDALENELGFCRAPVCMMHGFLTAGDLVHVMPGLRAAPKPIYLVYPHRHALNRRALVLIEAVRDLLSLLPGLKVFPFEDLDRQAS